MREGEKQERMRQREKIREFDRMWHKCAANGMEPVETLLKGIYIVVIGCVMMIPYEKEICLAILPLNGLAVWIYMLQKVFVSEDGKNYSIYEKLKYVPVSPTEIRHVRIGYLINFLKKPFVVSVIAQLLGAWLCNHEIGITNIVYPLLMQGAYPLVIGVLMTYESH